MENFLHDMGKLWKKIERWLDRIKLRINAKQVGAESLPFSFCDLLLITEQRVKGGWRRRLQSVKAGLVFAAQNTSLFAGSCLEICVSNWNFVCIICII